MDKSELQQLLFEKAGEFQKRWNVPPVYLGDVWEMVWHKAEHNLDTGGKLCQLDPESEKTIPYIIRMGRNALIDIYRKEGRYQDLVERAYEQQLAGVSEPSQEIVILPNHIPLPEQNFEAEEWLWKWRKVVYYDLSEAEREAYLEQQRGLDKSQMAVRLGKTEAAVEGNLKRANKRIREILADPERTWHFFREKPVPGFSYSLVSHREDSCLIFFSFCLYNSHETFVTTFTYETSEPRREIVLKDLQEARNLIEIATTKEEWDTALEKVRLTTDELFHVMRTQLNYTERGLYAHEPKDMSEEERKLPGTLFFGNYDGDADDFIRSSPHLKEQILERPVISYDRKDEQMNNLSSQFVELYKTYPREITSNWNK